MPVEFGAIAGHRMGDRLFPKRRTPLTDWHVAQGAVLFEGGLRWQRPGYYPQAGEDITAATMRESGSISYASTTTPGACTRRLRWS